MYITVLGVQKVTGFLKLSSNYLNKQVKVVKEAKFVVLHGVDNLNGKN